jgi:hypothetical protein
MVRVDGEKTTFQYIPEIANPCAAGKKLAVKSRIPNLHRLRPRKLPRASSTPREAGPGTAAVELERCTSASTPSREELGRHLSRDPLSRRNAGIGRAAAQNWRLYT